MPDYVYLFQDCIDKNLSKLHHELHTQHQWIFEAVNDSIYFSCGVKVCNRSYSSKKVVEFQVKPKRSCVSDIGQKTGLEAVTTHCR